MKPRLTSPALSIAGALESLQALSQAATDAGTRAGLRQNTLDLVSLRASQINGCAVCLDLHARALKKGGETDERLATLAAWRETPYFSEAERAALALAEAATRLSDRANPVPDEIWDEAARHFDEPALAALVVTIAADQHLEPTERHDRPDRWRVDCPMGRLVVARTLQGLAWLIVAGLVAEFYLAGAALFGVTPSFQPHRALGGVLAIAILVLLIVALIARPGRRLVGQVALLAGLTIVQAALPSLQAVVPAFAALHVVNAAVLLGLAGPIARMTSRLPAEPTARERLAMAGSRS